MSKSVGNFYTLRDLLKSGYTGRQIRYMLLQTHYRTQLNFTFTGLEATKHSLERLDAFIQRLQEIQGPGEAGSAAPLLKQGDQAFSEALADDLNISVALAALYDLVREVNVLCDAGRLGASDAQLVLKLLERFNQVLGFLQFEKEAIPQDLQEALTKRLEARREKNWALADSLRDQIYSRGYTIEDTPAGARLKKK